MKKIIIAFLVAVFALSFMLIPASADEFNTIDSAGLLTADEIQALEQLAVDIEADYGYCAMICFTDNINGYDSVRDYGEMLYNNYADCENAVIFVHDLNQNLCDFFIAEDYEEYVFDSDVTDPILMHITMRKPIISVPIFFITLFTVHFLMQALQLLKR